jgi:hypothetical protein
MCPLLPLWFGGRALLAIVLSLISLMLLHLSGPACPFVLPSYLPTGELPKGDDGSYGTSVTWVKAMDPASDVILAYKQNGRLLTPDHGYPLRLIIPGYIGGRMIKW